MQVSTTSLLLWAATAAALLASAVPSHVRIERRDGTLSLVSIQTEAGAEYDLLTNAHGDRLPGFADPFDARWAAALRRQVRGAHGKGISYAGWLVGMQQNDRNIHRYVYSRYCAAELHRFLEARYGGSIDSLNKAWNDVRYTSFEEVLDERPEPTAREGAMFDDYRAFGREVIRRANETLIEVIRREDPGKLIVSPPIRAGEDSSGTLELYSGFDALAVDSTDPRVLAAIHDATGKRVIAGEWSPPTADSASAGNRSNHTTALYDLPFVLGAHW